MRTAKEGQTMTPNAQSNIDRLAEVCRTVVEELVDHPGSVLVTPTLGEGGTTAVITVRADKSDYGKVIGRQGRNVDALRTLLEAVAAKHRMRLMLEIDDKPEQVRKAQ